MFIIFILQILQAKSNPYKTIEINIMGLTKALEAAVKIIKNLFLLQLCMFIVLMDPFIEQPNKQK